MSDFLQQSFRTKVTDAATTDALEEVGALRFQNNGKDAFIYMKSTANIAAKDVVAYDPAADDSSIALRGAANANGAGIANIAMDGSVTAVFAWVQVKGLVTGLAATMTAGQTVTAAAAGAVGSTAVFSANALGQSVATDTTKAILKGLL